MKLWRGLSVGVLAVVAASGGPSSKSFPATPPSLTIAKIPLPALTATPEPIPEPACSLVTPNQIKALLGEQVDGVETDTQSTFKSCKWSGGGSASAPNALTLSVIRIGGGVIGFEGSKVVGLQAVTVPNIGDSATFYSGVNSAGQNQGLFVADKGTVSLSINATFPGSIFVGKSLQADVAVLATGVFDELG